VAVADDGTIYVADAGTNRIGVKRTDAYTTFAGNTAGPRSGALFLQPRGLARDRDGNLYIADAGADVIRKVTPAGAVSTFAGSGTGDADGPVDLAKFRGPAGLAFDPNGNLYVAETVGRRIRKIDMTRPSAPIVSTLAGSFAARADWLEGKGATAHFDAPIGVAYGPDDKLYVADSNNHRIRTVAADGVTTTYAGTDASGTADGTLTSAIFDKPTGLAFGPDGTLYVSDAGAHRVRKLTRAGQVSTLAGHAMGDADGQALEAAFNAPAGLAVDAKGTVFVADAGNHKIRQITSDGAVSTVAGSGLAGWLDGTGLLARFDEPRDLVLGGQVALYVVDTATGRLRVVMP
jgi:sugar lactone lactonase YvrE